MTVQSNGQFPAAAGHGNLPYGNFSPVQFVKEILVARRARSVVDEITNSDYRGQISGMGSKVVVRKAAPMTTSSYARGGELVLQDITDENLEMLIDKGLQCNFRIDDVEAFFADLDWQAIQQAEASYALANDYDKAVLQYMYDNAANGLSMGNNASPVTVGYGTGEMLPADYIARAQRILDDNNAPPENRWFVAPPVFFEGLGQSDSTLTDISVTGDSESLIRMSKLGTSRPVHGFTLFKTTNLPTSGGNGYDVVLFGTKDAVSAIIAMDKSRVIPTEKTLGHRMDNVIIFGHTVVRAGELFRGVPTFSFDA